MGFVPPPLIFEGKEAFDEWLKERQQFYKISIAIMAIGIIVFFFTGVMLTK